MEKFILKNLNLLRVLIAILIGVTISVFLILFMSNEPGFSLEALLLGPFLTRSRLGNLVETAAPILFCGLAVAIPFQAGLFNVGAEGALYLGAVAGTAVAVSTRLPAIVHIPLVLITAGLTGALWGFIPGFLRSKWRVSELVTTLMLNYIALYLGLYLINYHFRDKAAGFLTSYRLPETSWLNQFIPGTRIHAGIFLALLFAVLVYILLYRTRLGYEIRMCGSNIHFSKYGGINIKKVIILSQVIGGMIAAIGGICEIMGIYRRFSWQDSPGYGWDGVVVAIIAKNNPLLIIPASLFLAYLRIGGGLAKLHSDIPTETISIIQAVIILLITADAFLSGWKNRITIKEAKEIPNESLA